MRFRTRGHDSLPDACPDQGRRVRKVHDSLERPLDFFEEHTAESGTLQIVEIGGLVDFGFRDFMNREPRAHARRARARASTSSAG